MSRRLTGTKRRTATRWQASVPVATGAPRRRTHTFDTETAADRWLAAACAALEAGEPLPVPPAAHLAADARSGAAAGTSFRSQARAWAGEYYGELHRGDVDRETTVLGHIDRVASFMEDRDLVMETMVRPKVKTLQASLTRVPPSGAVVAIPEGLDPDGSVTLNQAVALPGMASRSTLKRRIKDGTLTPVSTSRTGHRYRVADLYTEAVVGAEGKLRRGPRTTGSLSQAVANDVMWVFEQVCGYARDHGVAVPEDRESLRMHRTDREPSAARQPVTFAECFQIAGLHVVHQLALWLMRCLGLRIGEAFGIRVDDVIDRGPGLPGALLIGPQGGRVFNTRGPDEKVLARPTKATPKTRQSRRCLVVPPMLMDLLRAVIAVFHTDESGRVRTEARLIPGLVRADVGGQQSFRTALFAAAAAVGVDCTAEEDRVNEVFSCQPHDMRRAVLSDLDRHHVKTSHLKRFAGHVAGPDVLHRHYLLDDPRLRPGRQIAELLETELRAEVPTGLLVPTMVRCATGSQRHLAADAVRIDLELSERGWLVAVTDGDGDPLLTAAEVAVELGVTEKTARLWMGQGFVASVPCPDGPRAGQRRSRLSDVVEVRDRLRSQVTLADIAEQVQEPYNTVYQFVRAQGLQLEPWGERGHLVPDDVADRLRAHYAHQRALRRRAVPLAVAATTLGVTAAGVRRLITDGVLVEDERAHDGRRMVTRDSLRAASARVGTPQVRPAYRAEDLVGWAEARAQTGRSDAELDSLVADGTLVLVVYRRRRHLTRRSLLRYLLDTAPETLLVLPAAQHPPALTARSDRVG